MKKLQFKIDINAPVSKVYNTMLGLDDIKTYESWTAEFNPTSTYRGNWEKGTKMFFIGTDENGKEAGMVSEIADNVPNSFVSIRHYGIYDGEKEVTEGPDVESWAGGLENYSFEENNEVTSITVDTDAPEKYIDYFNQTWPKALDKLKKVVEE